jgi:hypothetical protein
MRRRMVWLLLGAAVGLVFLSAGAASAAKDGRNSSTVTTGVSSTSTATSTTAKPHPFGQTVSALRHAGDHTPAAVLMGKKVPGYYADATTAPTTTPESTTTTTGGPTAMTTVTQAQSSVEGPAAETTSTGPKVSPGNGKQHEPAAVLKGKKVPGHSK